MVKLTHLDNEGNIKMVNISGKNISERKAVAIGEIIMKPETIKKIKANKTPKGNVITTAKIAGIMAAKQTSNIIPLCHNIQISNVDLNFEIQEDRIKIKSEIIANDKTGAEMEALNSVTVAALTIYDMLKAIDKNMIITNITLLEKSGGKTKIITGKILSINISEKRGTAKKPVSEAKLIENYGIENDAHSEKNSIRQVSILSSHSIEKMKNKKLKINYGDFGENIDVDVIDIYKLPLNTEIEFLSGAKLVVSKIGKECHNHCNIYKTVGKCIMPIEGIFCKVIKGGKIQVGELFKIIIKEKN